MLTLELKGAHWATHVLIAAKDSHIALKHYCIVCLEKLFMCFSCIQQQEDVMAGVVFGNAYICIGSVQTVSSGRDRTGP